MLKSKAAGGDGIMSLQEFAKEPNSKVILSCIQCSPDHGVMKECTHMLMSDYNMYVCLMAANNWGRLSQLLHEGRMVFRYQVEMGWKPC